MSKVLLGAATLVYPMPAFLVGANVDGKPNFMTVAWGGIANGEPPMVSVAIRHTRHTLKGITENKAFSVNVPSADLVKETDYCGITPGSKVDKVKVCGFKVFYGKLKSVPLIEQCPVNLECSVAHTLDLGSHVLIVGKIEETYVSEGCLTDGKPDVNKIKPFGYTMTPDNQYRPLGETIARAFNVGKELRSRE
ncbi:MAG: flavin reductase family protein [Chloroflexi bacterium]|nr:flavin reductase family protein [Chloroflexota bacterium]MBM3173451.1 flavin reductase family protein [Chloroflexota bacterium]MBM3175524.1 flavin reductase family protein [Chloroflexota bacterium]MBM4450551.1 flavin reductase family protein [Chloroflexota bacterium]